MTTVSIPVDVKKELKRFLKSQPAAEIVETYLFYVQKKFDVHPVLFPKTKVIYKSAEDAVDILERKGELWHETEIKVGYRLESVNENTKRIYICPYSGKVFGDNTHPAPQDAIYDWVSKCPENTERSGGLRVKRFFVSEDPEVIQGYMAKNQPKEPLVKKVYSSAMSGKLFNSKHGVIQDFRQNYLRSMSLVEVQNQNRFEIEEKLLQFLQNELQEDKITAFVESLAAEEDFVPYVQKWLEGE